MLHKAGHDLTCDHRVSLAPAHVTARNIRVRARSRAAALGADVLIANHHLDTGTQGRRNKETQGQRAIGKVGHGQVGITSRHPRHGTHGTQDKREGGKLMYKEGVGRIGDAQRRSCRGIGLPAKPADSAQYQCRAAPLLRDRSSREFKGAQTKAQIETPRVGRERKNDATVCT